MRLGSALIRRGCLICVHPPAAHAVDVNHQSTPSDPLDRLYRECCCLAVKSAPLGYSRYGVSLPPAKPACRPAQTRILPRPNGYSLSYIGLHNSCLCRGNRIVGAQAIIKAISLEPPEFGGCAGPVCCLASHGDLITPLRSETAHGLAQQAVFNDSTRRDVILRIGIARCVSGPGSYKHRCTQQKTSKNSHSCSIFYYSHHAPRATNRSGEGSLVN